MMTRLFGRLGLVMTLMVSVSTSPTRAQEQWPSEAPEPRWSVEGAAGFQIYYEGHAESLAFGFAPNRSLTVLVSVQRVSTGDRNGQYTTWYLPERGSTEQFVSGEVRYAFLTRWRVAPYVLGGIGGGISRPNVNEFFPEKRQRHVQTVYYGGGVRIPVATRFDAFADTRLIMSAEAASDYFGVRMPVRAGLAWRF